MNADRWRQIEPVLAGVLDCPRESREAVLMDRCAEDVELRTEVQRLIRAYDASPPFLSALDHPLEGGAAPGAQPDLLIGSSVAHYRIAAKMGEGGMGVVYRALDTELGREVALKCLPRRTLHDPRARAHLLREARTAASLDHPNICTIHEAHEGDDQVFVAMALVEGQTLASLIDQGPLPVAVAIRFGVEIARALAYAHGHDIVHRDVKPSNILVSTDNQVKVTDFGLARPMSSIQLGSTFDTLGTVPYLSPERIRQQGSDHRADIWSFGVVLFQMLAGELPFAGHDPLAQARAILHADPPRPRTRRPETPASLERVVMKALAKRPEDRFQTMDEVVGDLSGIGVRHAARHTRRRRRLAIAVAVAMVAALVAWWIASGLPSRLALPPAMS